MGKDAWLADAAKNSLPTITSWNCNKENLSVTLFIEFINCIPANVSLAYLTSLKNFRGG